MRTHAHREGCRSRQRSGHAGQCWASGDVLDSAAEAQGSARNHGLTRGADLRRSPDVEIFVSRSGRQNGAAPCGVRFPTKRQLTTRATCGRSSRSADRYEQGRRAAPSAGCHREDVLEATIADRDGEGGGATSRRTDRVKRKRIRLMLRLQTRARHDEDEVRSSSKAAAFHINAGRPRPGARRVAKGPCSKRSGDMISCRAAITGRLCAAGIRALSSFRMRRLDAALYRQRIDRGFKPLCLVGLHRADGAATGRSTASCRPAESKARPRQSRSCTIASSLRDGEPAAFSTVRSPMAHLVDLRVRDEYARIRTGWAPHRGGRTGESTARRRRYAEVMERDANRVREGAEGNDWEAVHKCVCRASLSEYPCASKVDEAGSPAGFPSGACSRRSCSSRTERRRSNALELASTLRGSQARSERYADRAQMGWPRRIPLCLIRGEWMRQAVGSGR